MGGLSSDRGCTRLVLLLGPWAIKVPNFLYGWRAFLNGLMGNMQEVTLSGCGWPELCPVLWRVLGGFLIVMRRARILTDGEFVAFDAAAFCECGDYVVPAEPKSDSFGWLDGRIVAVDYGS